MQKKNGQGSIEYLLLIGGVILVGVIILVMVFDVAGKGKDILQYNLYASTKITDTTFDNTFIPLTDLFFDAMGAPASVIFTYSAPGANEFLLVVEKGEHGKIDVYDTSIAFTENADELIMYSLPFFETSATLGGLEDCTQYYFRLRACSSSGICKVSEVVSATPASIGYPCS
ncbi:MAG: class III signal peptide-containing protein [Candidatus Diapherotrites archaeon]